MSTPIDTDTSFDWLDTELRRLCRYAHMSGHDLGASDAEIQIGAALEAIERKCKEREAAFR